MFSWFLYCVGDLYAYIRLWVHLMLFWFQHLDFLNPFFKQCWRAEIAVTEAFVMFLTLKQLTIYSELPFDVDAVFNIAKRLFTQVQPNVMHQCTVLPYSNLHKNLNFI
jgi:hypothetical protein